MLMVSNVQTGISGKGFKGLLKSFFRMINSSLNPLIATLLRLSNISKEKHIDNESAL